MKGFDVTVADGAKPPIDKACGEGLMPDTLRALRELGVAIRPEDGQVFADSLRRLRKLGGRQLFECERFWNTPDDPPPEDGRAGRRVWS